MKEWCLDCFFPALVMFPSWTEITGISGSTSAMTLPVILHFQHSCLCQLSHQWDRNNCTKASLWFVFEAPHKDKHRHTVPCLVQQSAIRFQTLLWATAPPALIPACLWALSGSLGSDDASRWGRHGIQANHMHRSSQICSTNSQHRNFPRRKHTKQERNDGLNHLQIRPRRIQRGMSLWSHSWSLCRTKRATHWSVLLKQGCIFGCFLFDSDAKKPSVSLTATI